MTTDAPPPGAPRPPRARWGGDLDGTHPDSRILVAPPDPETASPDDYFSHFVERANAAWLSSVEQALAGDEALDDEASGSAPDAVGGASPDATSRWSAQGRDDVEEGIVALTQRRSASNVALADDARLGDARHDDARHDDARHDDTGDDVTVRTVLPDAQPSDAASTPATPGAPVAFGRRVREATSKVAVPFEMAADDDAVRSRPSEHTQRREAARLVPEVERIERVAPPVPESSHDGQMPSGVLSRLLGDVEVLVRYGHVAQVEAIFADLRRRYPSDLLLVRHIAEFHVAHGHRALALEALFLLASGLFERRNVEGMRHAVAQALQVDPENRRAQRLMELLDRRPDEGDARPSRSVPTDREPPRDPGRR